MGYETVEKDIAEGRLWRAKEVLQGRLAMPHFDIELMRRYGELLLLMGDTIEAGRYLFCSGARESQHAEAIRLFLSRHARDNPSQFLSRLPAMVRRQQKLSAFIASVEFETSGWTPEKLRLIEIPEPVGPKPQRPLSRIRRWGQDGLQFFVLGLFFLSFVVGFVTIISTIAREAWSILFR